MALAYSYIRFSTPDQIKGDSHRRQLELSEKYAKDNNLELDTTLNLRDLGISAFDRSNITKGALGQFLRLIEEDQIKPGSYLLVESLDRLSRAQIMDALQVFLGILNAGIIVVTLADGIVYSRQTANDNWANLIMSIVIMSRANEESMMKSKRVRAAWESKRKNIDSTILTARCPLWMKVKDDRSGFKLIPEKAKVIRWIFEQAKNGVGSYTIVRMLNNQQTPTFGKAPNWTGSVIEKILHSPTVYGQFQLHEHKEGKVIVVGDPIPNYYPAAISKEEFDYVNALRTSRLNHGGGRHKGKGISNLFSGLLKCGYCGETMTMSGYVGRRNDTGGVRTSKYVVCHGAKRGLDCHFIQWNYTALEKLALQFCKEIDFSAVINTQSSVTSEIDDARKHVATLRAEISDKEQKLSKLLEAIESGSAPKAVIKRMADLEVQIQDEKEHLDKSEKNLVKLERSGIDAKKYQASVVELFEQMETLKDDDLYAVRVRLAERLHRVFSKIQLFAGGAFGKRYAKDTIGSKMGLGGHKEPMKERRFIQITFHNGAVRIILENGSVLNFGC